MIEKIEDLIYKIDKTGSLKVVLKNNSKKSIHNLSTINEISDFIEKLDYSGLSKKNQLKVTNKIKRLKNMFQVQCLSTYGGPGLGKSTTALNVTADLKKAGINADYTSEVAKDKVYGKNLNELKDQSSIIGEQIKRLNTLVKSRDISIAVQDSPFVLGIAYQNKEDPHVDEEDFRQFYVKQYLNYINLNILLKRKEEVNYQEEGRVQTLEESIVLDKIIKKEVLKDNGLCYIELPAYEANMYMVLLGKTMNNLSLAERYEVYNSTRDKKQRSINYHILILEKTIKQLKTKKTDVAKISEKMNMGEDFVLRVLKEYKKNRGNEYVTEKEMIKLLKKSLKRLKKSTLY